MDDRQDNNILSQIPKGIVISVAIGVATVLFVTVGDHIALVLVLLLELIGFVDFTPTQDSEPVYLASVLLTWIYLAVIFIGTVKLIDDAQRTRSAIDTGAVVTVIVSIIACIVILVTRYFYDLPGAEDGLRDFGESTTYVVAFAYFFIIFPVYALRVRRVGGRADSPVAQGDDGNQITPSQPNWVTSVRLYAATAGACIVTLVPTVLLPSFFFSALNDTQGFFYFESVTEWLFTVEGQRRWTITDRQAVWAVSPGVVGVGVVILFWYRVHLLANDPAIVLSAPGRSRFAFIVIAIALCLTLGFTMISDEAVPSTEHRLRDGVAESDGMNAARLGFVLAYAGAFFGASGSWLWLLSRCTLGPAFRWLACVAVFTIAGAGAGLAIVLIRIAIVETLSPAQWHLVWMHGIGFGLGALGALIGGQVAERLVRRSDSRVVPVFSAIHHRRGAQ